MQNTVLLAFKTPNEDGYKTIVVVLLIQYDKQNKKYLLFFTGIPSAVRAVMLNKALYDL